MRKHEWRTCTDVADMLHSLRSLRVSDRKLRLFGCGCCRQVESLLPNERYRAAILVAEQFAEVGGISVALTAANREVTDLFAQFGRPQEQFVSYYAAHTCVCVTASSAGASANAWYGAMMAQQMQRMVEAGETLPAPPSHPIMQATLLTEKQALTDMLRDIFENPFRRVWLNSAWLTSDVLALARGIYDDRAFDRMPILADALQDAGCDSGIILSHCRDPQQVHVRGCWVVDLVLGKL